ncbi:MULTISPECIES: hypothetical protein [Lysinibacillus]|uniref:hypothetical protein n=1 Tax=Lysinibacillus TaxID=400634 RepID=UPI00158663DC|nr:MULTISPECIES: hypothetical protein [Lysinibacillus]
MAIKLKMRPWSASEAHRTPSASSALCESEASATKLPVGTEITSMSLLHLLNN